MTIKLLLLEGDGIGPEITAAARTVLTAADAQFGLNLVFETADIGFTALAAHGPTIPDAVIAQAKVADGVILGPVSHNSYPPAVAGGLNPSGVLRKALDLYANIRPARTRGGFMGFGGKAIDLVVVRENTEGFYADRNMFIGNGEFMPTPDVALAVRKVTREASLRIAVSAFELAMTRTKRVTVVHKANVLRVSDGLFRSVALNKLNRATLVVNAMVASVATNASFRSPYPNKKGVKSMPGPIDAPERAP
jgi:isocitrate/isopropylmalate dehydrogenase